MLDANTNDRFARLVEARINERLDPFRNEIRQIGARAAQRGMGRSSVHADQVFRAYQRELEIRAVILWESLVRAHRSQGSQLHQSLRDTLKGVLSERIAAQAAELQQELVLAVSRIGLGTQTSLASTRDHAIFKHGVEADLYVDFLEGNQASHSPVSNNYNFYGAVGAVQTGSSSRANVVQHISAQDRQAIEAALQQVREALEQHEGSAKERAELLDIVQDCQQMVSSPEPNSTKLMAMLTILGTSVQSIASARPAYEAMKAALLPLGVTLP